MLLTVLLTAVKAVLYTHISLLRYTHKKVHTLFRQRRIILWMRICKNRKILKMIG